MNWAFSDPNRGAPMDRKPKISPNHTFIFDEDDLEELDELSLTFVMRDAAGAIKRLEGQEDENSGSADDSSVDPLEPKDR